MLGKGAHDVVIESCDISGWGRVDKDGWGVDYDSAVYSKYRPLTRVIIQRNRLHHPRSNANCWQEFREGGERYHPKGPQGICFFESAGHHVFRYNLAYDNGKHGITWNRNPGNMEVTGNVSIDSAERNFNFDGGSSTFSDNVSCRGSSGTNDRIIGTDLGTNCWWTDGANTCGASTCDPYSGELSWWFNPDGSLEYQFQQPDQGAHLNRGDAKPATVLDADGENPGSLPVIGLIAIGAVPGAILSRLPRRRWQGTAST